MILDLSNYLSNKSQVIHTRPKFGHNKIGYFLVKPWLAWSASRWSQVKLLRYMNNMGVIEMFFINYQSRLVTTSSNE